MQAEASASGARRYRGPPAVTLLTLLFVGLKLTGHIDWSWWWVLSPIWIVVAVGFLCAVLREAFTGKKRKDRPG